MTSTTDPPVANRRPWRTWVLTLSAILGVALTFRLGLWQLSRAEEKITLQAHIESQAKVPPLSAEMALSQPDAWSQVHRPVVLQGQWLTAQTVYLDNRNHHGQPGFWVMTPLRWATGQVVWVQRGWVQRDLLDPSKAPSVSTPAAQVTVTGRVAAPLSHMVELVASAATSGTIKTPRIQSNLDMAQMQSLVNDNVNAVVIQTGPDSDGLRRDWPVVAQSAVKNKGYAFQWFSLSALIAGLYLWFQWIQPLRHAPSTN